MNSEITNYADFSKIRYAQCWEDADVLINALDIKDGGNYLSISSAGDNSLSMLCKNPAKVIAVDLNPSQIACAELRKAAYKYLTYDEMLAFSGIRPCNNRIEIYQKLKFELPTPCYKFWDAHLEDVRNGFYHNGKFENYFSMFRNVVKLIHSNSTIDKMLEPKTREQRYEFYDKTWNTFRWRLMFKVFFSRKVMGKFGRDPAFFRYVDVPVSERISQRAKYALTELDTSKNPYLYYIFKGNFGNSLPHALREENFEAIKKNIDNFEIHLWSVETALEKMNDIKFDGFNLSDIFEYMSEQSMEELYVKLLNSSNPNARIVYWNMLAPRSVPKNLESQVTCQSSLEKELFAQDKAFFYSSLHIEEVNGINTCRMENKHVASIY